MVFSNLEAACGFDGFNNFDSMYDCSMLTKNHQSAKTDYQKKKKAVLDLYRIVFYDEVEMYNLLKAGLDQTFPEYP